VKQDEKWVRSFSHNPLLSGGQPLYAAGQYGSKNMARGILRGYYLRLLDCSNHPASAVTVSLQRLTVGLIDAGHDAATLYAVLRGLKPQALIDLRDVESVCSWAQSQRVRFSLLYDGRCRFSEQNAHLHAAVRFASDSER